MNIFGQYVDLLAVAYYNKKYVNYYIRNTCLDHLDIFLLLQKVNIDNLIHGLSHVSSYCLQT